MLGATNDQFVEVKDGLVEDEEVVLNPRAVIPEARASKKPWKKWMSTKKFGKERKAPPNARRSARAAARRPNTRRSGGPAAVDPAAGGGPGAGGPGGGGSGGGQRRAMNLMQFDKDGDGKISKEEMPEQAQAVLRLMDTNGDGFVDAAEMAEIRKRMRGGGGPGGPGGGGPGGGGGLGHPSKQNCR